MVDISICITTYNVDQYLRQCLDSILMQKTKYSYEVIVCDDASTDNTRCILEEYDVSNPGVFKLFYNEKNIRYAKNYAQALKKCDGRYIAILDGDDYWTDANKLELQISYMEGNLDCTMTHHDGYILKAGNFIPFTNKIPWTDYSTKELLTTANIWNSSVVYRNILHGDFPEWLYTSPAPYDSLHIDYPLHVLHSQKGRIHFFKENMGVYRVHENNISVQQGNEKLSLCSIFIMKNLKPFVRKEFHSQMDLISARHLAELSGLYRKNGAYKKALVTFFKSLLKYPFRSIQEYKDMYYHVLKN